MHLVVEHNQLLYLVNVKTEQADDVDVSSTTAPPVEIKTELNSSMGNCEIFRRSIRGGLATPGAFVDLTLDD